MNPYQVLGVSENASDDEIRSAYLKLVKKYHPDRYTDNPLKDLATEKLKEINQAYDTITKQRESAGNSGYNGSHYRSSNERSYNQWNPGNSGNSGYSGNSSYSGSYSAEFQRVRSALNTNNLNEAMAILNGISLHNAEWNYLYGLVCFRSGDYLQARSSLEQAVSMEPNNSEYRNAYDVLLSCGGRGYYNTTNNTSSNDSCNSACNICSTLWCMDSCCECMGGDLFRCC